MLSPHLIQVISHTAYEALRAYKSNYDEPEVSWAEASDDTKAYIATRVERVLTDPRAGDATFHNEWVARMKREGWDHGKFFDAARKADPLMVQFHLLPPEQQARERLFRAIVISLSRV